MFEIKPLSDEEKAIIDAVDTHKAADKDDDLLVYCGMALYAISFVGVFLSTLLDNKLGFNVSMGVLVLGAAVFILRGFWTHPRELRLRAEARSLIDAYKRKNAIPLYKELQEKFSDQSHIHFHLHDDGMISVNDRRERSKI